MDARVYAKQGGSTFIGALLLVLVFGFLGSAVVELASIEQGTSSQLVQTKGALYVGQAGLEYAKAKLDDGENPTTHDTWFADGLFSVTIDPSVRQLTVTSTYGDSKTTQTIATNFSKDCVSLDTSTAYTDGTAIRGVKLTKTCHSAITVSTVTLDWNWPSCGIGEGSIPYENYADPSQEGHIFVCHLPSCNEDRAKTISVPVSDWEGGHSNHECDYLGECGAEGEVGADGSGSGSGSDDVDGVCNDFDDSTHEHRGAVVTALGLAGTAIYNTSQGIGSPSPGGADATVEIDVVDYTLTTNGDYIFSGPGGNDILFSQTIPTGGWYMITVKFEDGSDLYSIFTL